MFKGRSMQTKLFFTYSVFLLLLLLGLAIPIYNYLNDTIIKNTNDSVRQVVVGISSRMNDFIDFSETITKQIYYNKNLMDAFQLLQEDPNDKGMGAAYKEINGDVFLLSSLNPKINRVSIFTSEGDFFSNKPNDFTAVEIMKKSNTVKAAREKKGTAIITYSNNDPWLENDSEPVLSFIRQIRSGKTEAGFLEVQIRMIDILGNTSFSNIQNGHLFLINEKDILYTAEYKGNPEYEVNYYRRIIAGNESGENNIHMEDGRNEHIIYQYSTAAHYYVVYAIPDVEMYKPLRIFKNSTIGVFVAILCISLLVFYILSRILTKPLIELKKALKDSDILEYGILIDNSENNDEIKALNKSFYQMRTSLKKTMEENVKAKTLQLKTHFEVLQAQINPHFLFNMLGIIAISCDKNGAKDASEICRKLASFLRYSISTNKSVCTMRDEIQFAVEFLELLKHRYTHRLEFEINIAEELREVVLPKLTLQPLIENSIAHGFGQMDGVMNIRIFGTVNNHRWYVTISDNGCGFSEEVLCDINQKIGNYSKDMIEDENLGKASFGGMGIVNTFARLKLLHKNEIDFEIGNNPDGNGAYVKISGNIKKQNELEAYGNV